MSAIPLCSPLPEEAVRALVAGDEVCLSGLMYTGRDRFHKYLADGNGCPVSLRGGVLFHCGPVVVPDATAPAAPWRVVAAGPTTSSREEPYEAGVIEREGLRAIVGKGGMGPKTVDACRRFGCVYLQAVGGAAALFARRVRCVRSVDLLDEFGATEACWGLEVEDFPAIVGIDASGHSLYETVRASSRAVLDGLFAPPSPSS